MKSTPTIFVRLIHIDGPLKGKEQEFHEPVISIGRDSSCQVNFPKDLTLISRKHAKIVREGNRFKVIDQSTNGTIINGKKVKEAFLKTGDVLIIGEGGPKVSFLTETKEDRSEIDNPPFSEMPEQTITAPEKRPVSPARQKEPLTTSTEEPAQVAVKLEPSPPGEIFVERVQVPLATPTQQCDGFERVRSESSFGTLSGRLLLYEHVSHSGGEFYYDDHNVEPGVRVAHRIPK